MTPSDPPREALDDDLGWHQRWVARIARKALRQVIQRVETQGGDLERLAAGHDELQRHLDARIDQAVAEISDLREAFLAARGEIENVRDRLLPDLVESNTAVGTRLTRIERDLKGLHDSIVEIQGALVFVRDDTMPRVARDVEQTHASVSAVQQEVERVRDMALPQIVRDVSRNHDGMVVLQAELEGVRDDRIPRLAEDFSKVSALLAALQTELESVRDGALPAVVRDVEAAHAASRAVQSEVEHVRDSVVPAVLGDFGSLRNHVLKDVQGTIDGFHGSITSLQNLGEELRDHRLPALAGRLDAVVGQLYEELSRTGGLVDRLIAREPIEVTVEPETDRALPEAFCRASQTFSETFRGDRKEIVGRVEEYLPLLRSAEPILDLGCGRGEVLEVLQREGIEARGVDLDHAMVAACKRRGLEVEVGDAIDVLEKVDRASLGAVTAIHVVEHLSAASWLSLIEGARTALRPGGLLVIESPNPESLRVGAGLFWIDPTHRSPVHREAVAFAMRASGFEIVASELIHPFPPEQSLARHGQSVEVRELAERLDDWLSGPRDFRVVGRRPS